jgi:NAD+ synthase (glutamine-hydrolysing)
MRGAFGSIYTHGFIRAAVCIPTLRVADPRFNAERTIALARRAASQHAAVALFPELGLSAYTNDDLFHQDALLEASRAAIADVVKASGELGTVLVVGAPLRFEGRLFNCAVVIHAGKILGLVPKLYLPNYREFYEKRQFTSGRDAGFSEVNLFGTTVPFGSDLIFETSSIEAFKIHVEICEDVWTPIPPSTYGAMAGATVLLNLSASNITIGKASYRRELCTGQSSKCIAAYLYSAAGPGESTTDLAWDGQAIITENGEILSEADRFPDGDQMITADIDLERLAQERMRSTSFGDSAREHRERVGKVRRVAFDFSIPAGEVALERSIHRYPFVPANKEERDELCYEAYNIQVHGLMKRLAATRMQHIVIGVSGGLDSTHALIVAARTMDRLKLPRENILAYSLPGFATSERTRDNAHKLMRALGVTADEIDIRPSCMQMFKDLKHPFAEGKPEYDITFENVQAGQRTSILFRLANQRNGLVLGTGDLSELALGWATYGVGDQMSHYGINSSVPKTLIQHLIRWVITTKQFGVETGEVLQSILETEISPELVPHHAGEKSAPAQRTADKIGPYDLQDFNLYYITRYGLRPSKVAFLSLNAWGNQNRGDWPEFLPNETRHQYDLATIKQWLELFLRRFIANQFKRTAMPNGPKVGSGGSLSPRGDWRAPSDAEATVWVEELKSNVP